MDSWAEHRRGQRVRTPGYKGKIVWLGHVSPPGDSVPNSLPHSRDNVFYLYPFKSQSLGSQDPQGGDQVHHLCPWDPPSCSSTQSHSALFTNLCVQRCSPAVVLDPINR